MFEDSLAKLAAAFKVMRGNDNVPSTIMAGQVRLGDLKH